jgi:hypothetical protein
MFETFSAPGSLATAYSEVEMIAAVAVPVKAI